MKIAKYGSILLVGSVFFFACKKDIDVQSPNPVQPVTVLSMQQINDSALMYTKDIYLWKTQIPSTFTANNYSDPNALMTAVRQYSIEPGFTQPVDRWSFAVKKQEWDKVSSGIAGDFGLEIFFRAENDLRVKSVERASPAGKAGVRRGWRITKVNGSENISTSNVNFIVNAVYESTSTNFTFQKPDNSVVTLTLNKASYQTHPIILDSIYTTGTGQKVGYLVFNSFLGDTTEIYNEFSRISNNFAQANVSDVVIDLRYNGGGYVSVAEKMANYFVNASANGNIMMKQEFNATYSSWNTTERFNKIGSLNLNRIFFIVSRSTASASELVINNLKPYMDVVLVGPSNSYGKPVGFFPIPVADWYIFPVSFRTTNKNGEGSYFGGLQVNKQSADGLDKDWGDVNESSFGTVLSYISTGAFPSVAAGPNTRVVATEQPQVKAGNIILDEPSFKGTIDIRGMKK